MSSFIKGKKLLKPAGPCVKNELRSQNETKDERLTASYHQCLIAVVAAKSGRRSLNLININQNNDYLKTTFHI